MPELSLENISSLVQEYCSQESLAIPFDKTDLNNQLSMEVSGIENELPDYIKEFVQELINPAPLPVIHFPDWEGFYNEFEDTSIERTIGLFAISSMIRTLSFSKLSIEFSKRSSGTLSPENVVKYWNQLVSEPIYNDSEIEELNTLANKYHLPIRCLSDSKLELIPSN